MSFLDSSLPANRLRNIIPEGGGIMASFILKCLIQSGEVHVSTEPYKLVEFIKQKNNDYNAIGNSPYEDNELGRDFREFFTTFNKMYVPSGMTLKSLSEVDSDISNQLGLRYWLRDSIGQEFKVDIEYDLKQGSLSIIGADYNICEEGIPNSNGLETLIWGQINTIKQVSVKSHTKALTEWVHTKVKEYVAYQESYSQGCYEFTAMLANYHNMSDSEFRVKVLRNAELLDQTAIQLWLRNMGVTNLPMVKLVYQLGLIEIQ